MTTIATIDPLLRGGCLCGKLRYALRPDAVIDAGYCHCRSCQRSAGAPVLAWLTLPIAAFDYLSGRPVLYPSSDFALREFCGHCGTQLVFRYVDKAPTLDVTLASLDHPELVPPEYHIWRISRISWFETQDSLPRHDDAGPDRHQLESEG